jgi:excisionase family DNA binding protein
MASADMLVLGGEEYLDSGEAARLLGVKRETLYAYVSRGLLRSYRQGIKRQRLYRREDVEDLLRVTPAAGVPKAERLPRRQRVWEIPLAESWVRD